MSKTKKLIGSILISLAMLFSFHNSIGLKDVSLLAETNVSESNVSMLGHVRADVKVYKDLNNQSSFNLADATYQNQVYYIKKKAVLNNDTFYLLSEKPSATEGTIGWVRSDDVVNYTHKTLDATSKTFYVSGDGSAFTKAWGGSKDLVFNDVSEFKYAKFEVNLTESVGNNLWYRGKLDGKLVFVHSSSVTEGKPDVQESNVSLLGHVSGSAEIHRNYLDLSDPTAANPKYTNQVYYIKKQAVVSGTKFYLLSLKPSASTGTIGWVKSSQVQELSHKTKDSSNKTFYIKGTGKSYTKAWGGSKDLVFSNLSSYKDQAFKVNLTETVGNNTWYRGTIAGRTMWLHSSYVYDISESSTSLLGHLRGDAVIYDNYITNSGAKKASPTYTNQVYYVKKQANVKGTTYFLVSNLPSSSKGVLGWVKASDLDQRSHKTVDNKQKVYYLNGKGQGFTKTWGGQKDLAISSLSDYKYSRFVVNLTETVGNNTWYRGVVSGKTIWVHSSQATSGSESSTSLLGHLRGGAIIYSNINNTSNSTEASPTYTNAVYYIKKQMDIGSEKLYLISTQPSATNGTIGWVSSSDMNVLQHVSVKHANEIFYLTGKGSAFTKAWGGSKDRVISNLETYQGEAFKVNLIEKVGNNVWYRGTVSSKTVWVHSSSLRDKQIIYTQYPQSLSGMLDKQMSVIPQTDLYRSATPWVSNSDIGIENGTAYTKGKITGTNVNLRSEPNTSSTITKANQGDAFMYLGSVTGTSVSGSRVWYKIKLISTSKVHYVHSSLASVSSVKYYESNSSSSHYYGRMSFTSTKIFESKSGWSRIAYSPTWRNAKRSDVQKYVDPSKQDDFQFIDLSTSLDVSSTELNRILSGKGILNGKGSAYIEASKKYGVNEAYLISHSLLETGHGTSTLSTGVKVGLNSDNKPTLINGSEAGFTGIKTVYNMYGIGARDSNPLYLGAVYAYTNDWTTVDKAIIEGAAFVSENYFARNQTTLYKMRWNPANPGSYQYATDIGWAAKQVYRMKDIYEELENPKMVYDIPVYK